MTWWANRKSRIGMSPIAKEPPPLALGKPWWTSPPIAAPMPEHIEYVAEFQRQLVGRSGREAQAMTKYVADWMRTAKRLLHEDMQVHERPDLSNTEGLLMASYYACIKAISVIVKLGGEIPPELSDVRDALNGRTAKIRRERAIAPVRMRRMT